MVFSVVGSFVALFALAAPPVVLEVPTAYPTIQAAIDAAQPGQTVHVGPGTYTEALVFKDGITLEGASRDEVIVRSPAEAGPVLTVTGCPSGVVRYMTFEHTDPPTEDSIDRKPAAVVEIADSSIELFSCAARHGGGSGFRVQGKSECKILTCEATDNLRIGIIANGPDVRVRLIGNTSVRNLCGISLQSAATGEARYNRCEENRAYGIEVHSEGTTARLVGNVCSRNGNTGIIFSGASGGVAHGNLAEENLDSGIDIEKDSTPLVSYNTLRHNERFGINYRGGNRATGQRNDYLENGHFSQEEAVWLLYNEEFDKIEKVAERLRRDKTKTTYGEWQLPNLYGGLISRCYSMNAQDEAAFLKRMALWDKQFPNSITRYITLGMGYTEFAWRERGSGWASEVSSEGWLNFRRYLKDAMQTLEQAEKLPTKDPHLYVAKAITLRGMGKSKPETRPFFAIMSYFSGANLSMPSPAEICFNQGVALDATYYPLYYERVIALLPRWQGSPRQLVAFAKQAARATEKREGKSMYARIATSVLLWEKRDEFRAKYPFSWPEIKQGYKDILDRYPESVYRRNMFAYFAGMYGDRDTAREIFAQIGDKWDEDVWDTEAQFAQWKEWAGGAADNPSQNPLQEAIYNGSVREVKRLIAEGANPNSLTETGESMLVHAIEQEELEIARGLIEAGVDVNFVPPEGTPAILAAAGLEDGGEAVGMLLRHKADPNIAGPEGWTALLEALSLEDSDAALLLLDHAADPNVVYKGASPLHYAAEYDMLEATQKLLAKGADPNAANALRYTPLQYAAQNENIAMCAALLEKGADPNKGIRKGWTPLFEAVDRGNLELLKLLVEHGGDINQKESDGWSLFHSAAQKGSPEMLQYLLELNPDGLNAVTETKRTLLQQAAKDNNIEIVRFLLEKGGIDINARDAADKSALAYAQEENHAEIVTLLQQKGAT